ncbi:alpha/beta hydrolase [Scytonema sp. PRP1]|uniref:alpha/beta hydrolase n=1 Tax=Scytonema sp. PRP1 TaxID=3120513 RepID=UPI00300D69C0
MIKDKQQEQNKQAAMTGLMLARPTQPTLESVRHGLQPLGLDAERDALLYVPKNYQPDKPAPLVLMLHGAGGDARGGLAPFLHLADAASIILLAPASRQKTWDMLYGEYGSDIAFIDSALMQTFSRYAVDPAHIAVEGFSDGASYALSVGITNGDLFSHVIAFSPGFMAPKQQHGEPQIFISHGKWDNVLPIDRCSRKIVPQLQRANYDVVYQEFNGFHTVPTGIARSALTWFTAERE